MVYVTALSGNAIYEVDTNTWKVARRLETPAPGPYNAAVGPDERLLVVTYKKGDSGRLLGPGRGPGSRPGFHDPPASPTASPSRRMDASAW